MNEIVIDIDKLPKAVREELKERAIREQKPLKVLLAEIIEETTETILTAAGQPKEVA